MNPRVKITREQMFRALDGSPVQVQTPVGLLEVEAIDNEWMPLWKIEPTPPHMVAAHEREGLDVDIEVWRNETYEVIVTRGGQYRKSTGKVEENDDGLTHLSIKRYDRAPCRNWRHFQQVKNEICGETAEAVEVYPAEARLADNANQYHLFAFPEGFTIPIGFGSGMLTSDDDAEAYTNDPNHEGRQEPWQDGLTTGSTRNDPQPTGATDAPEA